MLGGWVTSKFLIEGVIPEEYFCVTEKYIECPVIWYQNIAARMVRFDTIPACDRRTDGIAFR